MSIYDTKQGSGIHDTKIKLEYDITYTCVNCDNELSIENMYCSNCGAWIDWLKVLKKEEEE